MPAIPPTSTAAATAETSAEQFIPASVANFARDILPQMHKAARGQQMVQTIADLVKTERWNSFDQFHKTTETMLAGYEAAGAATEVYVAQTGSRMGTGRWVIPEATDLRESTVDIISPIEKRLIDYQQNPWQAIMWGNSTPPEGITGELVVIDQAEALERLPDNWLKGKIVLSRLGFMQFRAKFYNKGAVAVIFDPIVADCPDATAWVRFGWGSPPLRDIAARPIGFVLTVNEGDALRNLVLQHGKLTLRIKADLRRYVGTHDIVSGIVKGRDDPQAEVWAYAHSCEPGALDNSSGVAVCIEIARMLNELIAAGKLPRPRRSIRFINGFECYGFFNYYDNVPRFQPPLAGVDIDIIGSTPERCGSHIRWYATVPSSATFVDEVGEVMLQAAMKIDDAGYTYQRRGFLCTEDTLLGDPQYGFPCPWITNHPIVGYHSDADTVEHAHPRGLTLAAASMAAYLYYLADAGTAEAIELADWETRNTAARLRALSGAATNTAQQRKFLLAQHEASMRQLQRFVWNGDRSQILSRFDACATQVHQVAEQVSQQLPAAPPAPAPGAAEVLDDAVKRRLTFIPRRTAALAPTPENVLPPLDATFEGIIKWAHYWANGERSMAEVIDLIRTEWNRFVPTSRVLAYFQTLCTLGYLEMTDPADMIGEEKLAADFKALGIEAGMDVMIHSSLSKIGPVKGGGPTVVRALLSVLGPKGNLLAPSFNHSRAKVYNPLTTPTINGAIAEAIWRHPQARRSDHPSHAVAAIGPKAADYVADHVKNGIWAENSPIGRLVHGGGYILALGVTHHTSTAFHVAELANGATCIDQFANTDRIVAPDGQVREVPALAWREEECPITDKLLDGALDAIQVQRHGKVGNADCSLVKAMEVWQMRRAHLGNACQDCPVQPAVRK